MTISNVYSPFLTIWIKTGIILSLALFAGNAHAQFSNSYLKFVPDQNYYQQNQDSVQAYEDYPEPKKVMVRSLIIPGWGQVTNKQIWKVPIVYGLIGGLTYYSIWLNQSYKDYRAAYYNLNPDTPDDLKFGPTPDYISANSDLNSLRESRNFYRNRRDFIFITVGLAYALNAIDAYVFAHLRSFDVSDDLSMNTRLKPVYLAGPRNDPPGIAVSVRLNF